MGANFHSNQAEAKPESMESQDQLIKQVESGVSHAWLGWKLENNISKNNRSYGVEPNVI